MSDEIRVGQIWRSAKTKLRVKVLAVVDGMVQVDHIDAPWGTAWYPILVIQELLERT